MEKSVYKEIVRNERISNMFVFSVKPLDGQYLEDNIVSIALNYFSVGVVINGISYSRNQQGHLSVDGHHYSSKYDQEEFFELFDAFTENASIPMMDQARIVAQVSSIIEYQDYSRRVEVRKSLKLYVPPLLQLLSSVRHESVEEKKVIVEQPATIKIEEEREVVEVKEERIVVEEEDLRRTLLPYFQSLNKGRKKRDRVRNAVVCREIIRDNRVFVVAHEVLELPNHTKRYTTLYLEGKNGGYDRILGKYDQHFFVMDPQRSRKVKRAKFKTRFLVARTIYPVLEDSGLL